MPEPSVGHAVSLATLFKVTRGEVECTPCCCQSWGKLLAGQLPSCSGWQRQATSTKPRATAGLLSDTSSFCLRSTRVLHVPRPSLQDALSQKSWVPTAYIPTQGQLTDMSPWHWAPLSLGGAGFLPQRWHTPHIHHPPTPAMGPPRTAMRIRRSWDILGYAQRCLLAAGPGLCSQ